MNAKQLAFAIRQSAEELAERYQNTDDALPLNKRDAYDHAEIMRCMARVVEGMPIGKAFGAPGDWGYSHPIGKALAEPVAVLPRPVRHCDCWLCLNTGPNGECERCGFPPSPDRLNSR